MICRVGEVWPERGQGGGGMAGRESRVMNQMDEDGERAE